MLENVQTFTCVPGSYGVKAGGGGAKKLRKILVYFVEKFYGSPNLQQTIRLKLRLKREPGRDMYRTRDSLLIASVTHDKFIQSDKRQVCNLKVQNW
jgi:hypothetical protein